jgi:hypothetical protein
MKKNHARLIFGIVAFSSLAAAEECPLQPAISLSGNQILALKMDSEKPIILNLTALEKLPQISIVSERRNQTNDSAVAPGVQSVTWSGVLLKDIVLKNGIEQIDDHQLRQSYFEVVAIDGYKAIFSWGELFNTAAGNQILIITKKDGAYLDRQNGPLAIRALADIRPGPRHVRNLCGVSVLK